MEIAGHKRQAERLSTIIKQATEELRACEDSVTKYCYVEIGAKVERRTAGKKPQVAEVRDIAAQFEKEGNEIRFAFYGRLVRADGELSNKMMRLWPQAGWKLTNGGPISEYERI